MSTKKTKRSATKKVTSNLRDLSENEQTVIAYGLALHSPRLLTINRLICVSKSFAIAITKAKRDIGFWKIKYESILKIKSLDDLISTRMNKMDISAKEWMEGYDALFKSNNEPTKNTKKVKSVYHSFPQPDMIFKIPLYPQNVAVQLELYSRSLGEYRLAKYLKNDQAVEIFQEISQHRPIDLRALTILFNQSERVDLVDEDRKQEKVDIMDCIDFSEPGSDAYLLYKELVILLSKGLKCNHRLSNGFINIMVEHKITSLIDNILEQEFDEKEFSLIYGLGTALDHRVDVEVIEKIHKYLKSINTSDEDWCRIFIHLFKYDNQEYIQRIVSEFKRFFSINFIMEVLNDEGLQIYGLSLPGSNALVDLIMELNISPKNLEKMLITAVDNSGVHHENKFGKIYMVNIIDALLKHPSFKPSCDFCKSGLIYKHINPDIMKIVLSTKVKRPNLETILSFLLRNIYHHTDEDYCLFGNLEHDEDGNEDKEETGYFYRGGCNANNSSDAIDVIITSKRLNLEPLFNVLPLILVIITTISEETHRINKIFNKTNDPMFTPHHYDLKAFECLLKDDRFDPTYHDNIAIKLAFVISNSSALLALKSDHRIKPKWKELVSNLNKKQVVKDAIKIIFKFMDDNDISRKESEFNTIVRNVFYKIISCFESFEEYFESDDDAGSNNKFNNERFDMNRDGHSDKNKHDKDITNQFIPSRLSFRKKIYGVDPIYESELLDQKYCVMEKTKPKTEVKVEIKPTKKKVIVYESFSSSSEEYVKPIKKKVSKPVQKKVHESFSD